MGPFSEIVGVIFGVVDSSTSYGLTSKPANNFDDFDDIGRRIANRFDEVFPPPHTSAKIIPYAMEAGPSKTRPISEIACAVIVCHMLCIRISRLCRFHRFPVRCPVVHPVISKLANT